MIDWLHQRTMVRLTAGRATCAQRLAVGMVGNRVVHSRRTDGHVVAYRGCKIELSSDVSCQPPHKAPVFFYSLILGGRVPLS